MASINYSIKSDKPFSSVYMRFAIDRKTQYNRKTGIEIPDPKKDWSGVIDNGSRKKPIDGIRTSRGKCMPKTNSIENKKLYSQLSKLKDFIFEEYNKEANNVDIDVAALNADWLTYKMQVFFNRVPVMEKDYVVNFGRQYCANMESYTRNGVLLFYSEKTKEKMGYLIDHLEAFERHRGRKLKFSDVDTKLADELNIFFTEELNHSINTRGTNFKKFKTVLHSAEKSGIKINPEFRSIKGFTDERIVTTLSFEELDKVIAKPMYNEKLSVAKDWLIIGCFTGQRISDLHQMNKGMIVEEDGNLFIKLIQKKSEKQNKKQVMIPITVEVKKILDKRKGEFPPVFYESEKSNRTEMGRQFKEVCRLSGITEEVRGRFNGNDGLYPKYKLISTHSCRRSFASNHYGTPFFTTPQLMEITGHTNEKNFLLYIGESENKFSKQNAESFKLMQAWRESVKSKQLKT